MGIIGKIKKIAGKIIGKFKIIMYSNLIFRVLSTAPTLLIPWYNTKIRMHGMYAYGKVL